METVLPPPDATLAQRPSRHPDKDLVRAAVAIDETILSIKAVYQAREGKRVAAAKVKLGRLRAEYEKLALQARLLQKQMIGKRLAIDTLKNRLRLRSMRPYEKKKIERRRIAIQSKQRAIFLRQKRIEFNQTVRGA